MEGSSRRTAGWSVLLALLTLGLLYVAWRDAMYFAGEPMDGALQFFNPLRRLSMGQRIGADFEVYHGPALSVLLWPVFRLLGGDIFASELIRQALMPLTLVGAYGVVFAAFTRSARRTVVLTTLAVLVTMALPLETLLIPGSSILGVRTAFPLLLVALLTLAPTRKRLVAEAGLLGVMPLLSVEQGIATAVAYIAAQLLAAYFGADRRADLQRLATVAGLAAVTFVVAAILMAGPRGAMELVRYNFADIPADQFWYFGAPPNRPLDSYWRFVERSDLTVLLLIGIVVNAWWVRHVTRRRTWGEPRAMAMTVLAFTGLLSATPLLAIWLSGYTHGLVRSLLILLLLGLDERIERGWFFVRGWRLELAAVGLLLVAAVTDTRQVIGALFAPLTAFADGPAEHTMSPDWNTTVTVARDVVARAPTGSTGLWSTYAGVVEASLGLDGPPRFDYLIHALGDRNRLSYLREFEAAKPAAVQTIDPRLIAYEEWLEVTSWDFYHALLLNYRTTALGPWSIFWTRRDQALPEPTLIQRWSGSLREGTVLELDPIRTRGPAIMEVEATYTMTNPWRWIPVIGQMPSFYIRPAEAANSLPVPLAPYRTTIRFPVVVADSGRIGLMGITGSLLPGAHLTITSLTVSRFAAAPDDSTWLAAFIEASKTRDARVQSPRRSLPTVR